MVRTLAGFHADATGSQLCHKGQQFRARKFLTDDHVPLLIDPMQLKHVFCQVNPKYPHVHS
jgi:hypothetical protein